MLLKYFDLTIDSLGKIKFRFKKEFKRKISPEEKQKIPKLNGPSKEYYIHCLGQEIGGKLFEERKKVTGVYNQIDYVLDNNLYVSEEQKTLLLKRKEDLKVHLKQRVGEGTWWKDEEKKSVILSKRKEAINRPEYKLKKAITTREYWDSNRSTEHRKTLRTNSNRFNLVQFQKENVVRNTENLVLNFNGKLINEPEYILACMFQQLGLEFEIEKNFIFNNRNFFPDFFIPKKNIIIEVYGDYWHANPRYFKPDEIVRGISSKEIWKRDEERKVCFHENNYTFIQFWETDIRLNLTSIYKLITTFK